MNATGYNNNYSCGRNRGRARSHGRRWFNYNNYNVCNSSNSYKPSQNDEKQERGKNIHNRDTKKIENTCYRCGIKEHWSRTCHTAKYLIDLYQSSMKGVDWKGKLTCENSLSYS
jgi:hypothetical protein